jgi:hypothetical protein
MEINKFEIPKIHLLMSVYITDESLYDKGLSNYQVSLTQNKAEQFLTVINSLKTIEFNTAEIHYEVSIAYLKWIDIINDQIRLCIPNATIHSKRLEYFNQWQKVSTVIPSDTETILLKTNHDHAFLHDNPSLFYKFIRDINVSGQNYIGEISHWPEAIGNSRSGKWIKNENQSNYYSITNTTNTIGTCLVNPEFFKSWWNQDFTDGSRIVRPDNPFGPSVYFEPVKKIVPNCEFFRHMDGYGHQKIYAPIASPIRVRVYVVQDRVHVTEWTKGDFLLTRNSYDLPPEPKLSDVNSLKILINIALLSTTYRFSIKNLWFISQGFEFRFNKYVRFSALFSLIINKYFLAKLLRQFLRINSIEFRVNQFKKFIISQFNF